MLDAAFLLNAMNGVHEKQVLRSGKMLGYIEDNAAAQRPRRLWTTLLVAAVLVSLFAATAYAMGWYGLRERMIESAPKATQALTESSSAEAASASPAEPKRWVSLNGYQDSPEYRANAEWLRFREEYEASHVITDDNAWMDGLDEETVNICRYYGVYDGSMLCELQALAQQYGLRLHTHQFTPLTLEDFYRAAGTGAFLTEGAGAGYIYEDGSFKLEYLGEHREYLLTIMKNLSGTILPLSSGMDLPERYREWAYTNVHGDVVLLALNEERRDISANTADLRIFFDADGVFIMAQAVFLEDGSVSEADCEQLADRIVFHELLKTEPDFSALRYAPTEAEAPEETATLSDFLSSPEGMAAREYSQAAATRRGTEAGRRELAALRPGIVDKYGLLDAAQTWEVGSQEHIDSGMFEGSPAPAINYDEFAAKGYDRRIAEQFYMLGLQDNGVILCHKSMAWFYIPFGSFCEYEFDLTAERYTDEWFYRTKCGAVVTLCADLGETSPVSPAVIYRTENGWLIGRGDFCHNASELEGWADEIDYTLFP